MNLSDFELTSEIVAEVEKQVAANDGSPATTRWRELCESLAAFNLSPSVYRAIWEHVFEQWDAAKNGPAPMWIPNQQNSDDANLSGWMKANNCDDYEAFHRWARENRSQFWQQAIERIGVKFETPPATILDQSDGVDRAKWLSGSRLNIAESCFLAEPNAIAIVEGSPDGTQTRISYGELTIKLNKSPPVFARPVSRRVMRLAC